METPTTCHIILNQIFFGLHGIRVNRTMKNSNIFMSNSTILCLHMLMFFGKLVPVASCQSWTPSTVNERIMSRKSSKHFRYAKLDTRLIWTNYIMCSSTQWDKYRKLLQEKCYSKTLIFFSKLFLDLRFVQWWMFPFPRAKKCIVSMQNGTWNRLSNIM